jgi:hypothetical protein
MRIRSLIAADSEPFVSEWAPKLLRLFHLYLGDQATAESLTIEVLAEAGEGRLLPSDLPNALLRRALLKAVKAPVPERVSADPVVRAVTSLPPDQRAAIVLFRGLRLDLERVAIIMRRDIASVKHLCTQAVFATQKPQVSHARSTKSAEPIARGGKR